MKPSIEIYNAIKPLPPKGEFFQHFPGVYCQNCGEDFALYSYSIFQPLEIDENNKPFYKCCGFNGCKI